MGVEELRKGDQLDRGLGPPFRTAETGPLIGSVRPCLSCRLMRYGARCLLPLHHYPLKCWKTVSSFCLSRLQAAIRGNGGAYLLGRIRLENRCSRGRNSHSEAVHSLLGAATGKPRDQGMARWDGKARGYVCPSKRRHCRMPDTVSGATSTFRVLFEPMLACVGIAEVSFIIACDPLAGPGPIGRRLVVRCRIGRALS